MSPPVRMIGSVAAPLSLLLYAAVALAWAVVARWLGRPLPVRLLSAFLLLPVLFLLPAFVTSRTIFPVDHALSFPPWHTLSHAAPANPNLNDVATEMGPWARAVRLSWKEGSLPWRNRWNACGSPLAANGQSAAFSPLTILTGLLPLVFTFNFSVAVKLFTALAGTWLWLTQLGVRSRASVFGAVLFTFSFTMVPWLLFPLSSVIALWPWALFAIESLRDAPWRGRATATLVALLSLQVLAGHPESLVLGGLFTGIWLVTRAALRDLDPPRTVLTRTAIAALLAAGLTAFLLLPQIAAIRDSNRAVTAREFSKLLGAKLAPHGPALPLGVVTTLLPRSLGDGIDSPMLPVAPASFPEMALGHFGLVGWASAFLLFRRGGSRSKREIALLVPLGIGFATAVLLWPVFDLLYVLPGVKLMLPQRFFTWVSIAGTAVAAFEIDRLARDAEEGRAVGSSFVVASGAVLLVSAAFLEKLRPLHAAAGALTAQRRAVIGAAIFLAAAAFLTVALSRRNVRAASGVLPLLLAILGAGELFWQGRRLYRMGPRDDFYPPTPLVEFLRRQPGPFRVVGEGATIYPSTNVFAGVEDVRIHDPVERRDYVEWLDRACGYDPAAYFKHVTNLDCPAFDFLNVKYFVAGPGRGAPGRRWRLVYSGNDGTVFENGTVLPRVFPEQAGAVRVTGYRETTNTVSFAADVALERTVVVASLLSDGGWTARDERDELLPVGRANGPFLAVTLPRGRHTVKLKYTPPGLRAGIAVSAFSAVIALMAAIRGRGIRRPAASTEAGAGP